MWSTISLKMLRYTPFILGILFTEAIGQLVPSRLLATSPEPPFVEIPGIKSSYFAMIASDTLNLLAEQLNFTLDVTHPPDFLFGGLNKNGQWDGIIGQLLRKEADLGASVNAITYARYTAVDFTVPVIYDVTGILIAFPEKASKILASIQPFSLEVWVAFFCSIIILCFTLFFEGKVNSSKKTFGHHVMWMASIITGQGTGYSQNRMALRVAMASWSLTSVVFIYVYTGVLTSILAVPRYALAINTLEDLATSSFIKPVTIKSTAVDDMMLNAKNGTYRLIGDTFRKYPNETLVANTQVGVRRAVEGNYGFLEPRKSLLLLMENDRKEHNSCRVTLAKQTFFPRAFAYTLPKKSPIKDVFDRQILLFQQFGLINHFQEKIVLHSDRCQLKNKRVRGRSPRLTLDHVSSSFAILFLGYAASFVAHVIERVVKRVQN